MHILIGLASALAHSLGDVAIKRLYLFSPFVLTFLQRGVALPILAIVLAIFSVWELPAAPFWRVVAVLAPLEVLLMYVAIKSRYLSAISLVVPFGAFTSIFLIPMGYFFLGETFGWWGLFGVVFIVVGSFVLGAEKARGVFAGYRRMLADPGVLLALASAFLASITATLMKMSFSFAAPPQAAFYITLSTFAVAAPFAARYWRSADIVKDRGNFLFFAVASGSSVALHFLGLSVMNAAYFISLKRLAIVMTVIAGRAFFREEHFWSRLCGAALMTAGVIFIALD